MEGWKTEALDPFASLRTGCWNVGKSSKCMYFWDDNIRSKL
jgi:hypothetical protein